MVRRTSLIMESLEERALLSSLSYSLTTNRSVYQVGQPIELAFTETNTSDQPVTVEVSPTDFTLSQGSGAIWQSNPGNAGQPPISETLSPGQSVTQTASWNGTVSYSSPFVIPIPGAAPSTVAVNVFGTFVVSNPNAPQGVNATFRITDPISYSLTTNQSVYQLGEPIQMTFMEINTSDQQLTVFPNQPAGFGISHNGIPVVLDVLPDFLNINPMTFQAGQRLTDTQTWNGIPIQGPYTLDNLTGKFVVDFGPVSGPGELTTTFRIAPPSEHDVRTSVTTNQHGYSVGQPVDMTFTETNEGNRPITILTGPPEFQVTQNGSAVWNATGSAFFAGDQLNWSTLQPGRSYTQTIAWNGLGGYPLASRQLTGAFTVSNLLDPNKSSATVQIMTASSPPTNPQPPPSSPSPSPVAITVSTNRSSYRLWQSVRISLKLTNVSTKNVAVIPKRSTENITVLEGSTVVYRSSQTVRSLDAGTLARGQSVTLTTLWPGRANQRGVQKLSPGVYTIRVADDGFVASTAVQIFAARVP